MEYLELREGVRYRGSPRGFNLGHSLRNRGRAFLDALQRRGLTFYRSGNRVYVGGDTEALLENFPFEETAFLDQADLFDATTEDIIPEISADEIEINTADGGEAVLDSLVTGQTGGGALAGATGAGAAAGSVAPSTIITGVTVAGATIGAGLTGGILGGSDKNHSDPVVSIPDHRFIGPGNTVDSDVEPTDTDDSIARSHDIAYNNAKTQEDIRRADDIAIHEFASDFVNTGNVHSAIGAAGLGVKRVVETGIGVQYPPNLPSSIAGKTKCLSIH